METAQVKHEKVSIRVNVLQARLDEFESGARERLIKALGAGQHRLTDLDGALEKWAREDWSVEVLRKRLEALRKLIEILRAKAVERMKELRAMVLKGFASSTRVAVQILARELDGLVKMLEPKAAAVTSTREVEVIPSPEPKPERSKQKAEV